MAAATMAQHRIHRARLEVAVRLLVSVFLSFSLSCCCQAWVSPRRWRHHPASFIRGISSVQAMAPAHPDNGNHHQDDVHPEMTADAAVLLDHLLDRAMYLHYQSCQQYEIAHFSTSSITDQLSSLVVFLSHQRHHTNNAERQPMSSSSSFHVTNEKDKPQLDSSSSSSSSVDDENAVVNKARELEQAMLAGASFAHVEALVNEFRQLQQKQQPEEMKQPRPTMAPPNELPKPHPSLDRSVLNIVQNQLDAFEQLLVSLDSSTTTKQTTTTSQPPIVVAAAAPPTTTAASVAARTPTARRTQLAMTASPQDDYYYSDDDDDQVQELPTKTTKADNDASDEITTVDVAIVGSGIAGLCAGAILNTLYGKTVGIYESHYLPGGCAHAFDRTARISSNNNNNNNKTTSLQFTFDSGPTILLGCSSPPYNALQQVLVAIGQDIEWIAYDGWGVIERPGTHQELQWKVQLGPDHFQNGPLATFGGDQARTEFGQLQRKTKNLLAGVKIPAMAMRAGNSALVPLLRYFPTLIELMAQGETLTGTFAPFMDGPLYTVTDPWLRNWLDALAFSLSGLPASRTAAAAMAFVLNDMHRPGAALDYPKGGMGEIIQALVRGVEQGNHGSKVNLRSHVESIDCDERATRITGLTLSNGKRIQARDGVICNAPVWSLNNLIKDERVKRILNGGKPLSQNDRKQPPSSWTVSDDGSATINKMYQSARSEEKSLLDQCDTSEMTGSFLHLHLAIDAKGLDISKMEAHYTVMDRSLSGNGSGDDGPCGELNMIALSNPCVIDPTLAPEGYMVLHAYGAGNEPFELWEGLDRRSSEYAKLKEERAAPLWRAVESIIPDVRDRVVLQLIGSPITHERFLRRPRGTYGSATEDYLKDGSTPLDSLVLANDGVFPGIGVPAVAIAGASAANKFVGVFEQWSCLDRLKREKKI